MKDNGGTLIGICVLIVLVVLCSWLGGLRSGSVIHDLFVPPQQDNWSPREYVPNNPNDCFVPPKGDPLYDAHYAEHVNGQNCSALKTQSEAKNIDAQTRQINTETDRGNFAVAFVVGTFMLAALLLFAASRH